MNVSPLINSKYSSFIAGSISGAGGILIGHPFDSLKVRAQVGGISIIKDRFLSSDYFKNLYRGIWPPLITAGIIQSLNFSIYEKIKTEWHTDRFGFHTHYSQNSNSLAVIKSKYLEAVFVGGTLSGLLISLITTPVGMIKVTQQLAVGSRKSMLQTLKELWLEHGSFKVYYKGFPVMLIMEVRYFF